VRIQLLHLNGPFRGRTVTYTHPDLLLGTSPESQIRYPESEPVAPRHARIRFDEEACEFRLKALDGEVFVNHDAVDEIVLHPGDLIEVGRRGPLVRFRIQETDKSCKPIRQIIHDAREVGTASGVFASARSLRTDLVSHSSTRVKVFLPLALIVLVFAVAYGGGRLGGSHSARKHRDAFDQKAELYEGELADVRERLEEFHRREAGRVPREEVESLRTELARHSTVVDDLARRNLALKKVLEVYTGGVCLLHGAFTFRAVQDGKVVDVMGPGGKRVELEYLGSGFLVSREGHVVTNRHVAEPWWGNPAIAPAIARGLKPHILYLDAYFPGRDAIAVDAATIRVGSGRADVAVLRIDATGIPVLPLHDEIADLNPLRGERVVLVGYPTGVTAMLARSDPELVEQVLGRVNDTRALIRELAGLRLVRPVITQGALNDVTPGKLVYDAETTSGGSGGPVFGPDGTVIGVNFAITRDFDGSNFGVPIRFARDLLP
jgi:S1-C subfamily serine protease